MRKISFALRIAGIILLFLLLLPRRGTSQFSNYNPVVRQLNYYLLYLDHLLSEQEQATHMMKDLSVTYQKNDSISFSNISWSSYKPVDVARYRQQLAKLTEAVENKYDAAGFLQYNKRNNLLPDSLNILFKDWILKADTIASNQNKIANELLALVMQYNRTPSYEKVNVYRIHEHIKAYHSMLSQLQQIRDDITAAALLYYEQMRTKKKYPFSIYKEAVDYLLQMTIHLNSYFAFKNIENDEAAIGELRKANESIQAYLKNDQIYRRNNDALPGHHVFPFNEEVHIKLSNTLKEIAFQINRQTSDYSEKVDSAFLSTASIHLINLLCAVSFSHDERIDVRKKDNVPERYHSTLQNILRYDFLMYRYDTYRNSRSNKNTAPIPLGWSRYVFTFEYEMPPPDTSATTPNIAQVPAETNPPKAESFNLQIIRVYADSLSLFFYDNGEIDNDTITIFVNGIVAASNVRLDKEPYELKLGFLPNEKSKDVTIAANNLGTIPPNTAYLKVMAGDQVFRLYLFSTKKINAVVRIINSKEVKVDQQ
jgi:hypothetical protein